MAGGERVTECFIVLAPNARSEGWLPSIARERQALPWVDQKLVLDRLCSLGSAKRTAGEPQVFHADIVCALRAAATVAFEPTPCGPKLAANIAPTFKKYSCS